MATFTEELLDQLRPDILHGNVIVDRDWQPYAEAISSRFPFVGSKIAWEKVPRPLIVERTAPPKPEEAEA